LQIWETLYWIFTLKKLNLSGPAPVELQEERKSPELNTESMARRRGEASGKGKKKLGRDLRCTAFKEAAVKGHWASGLGRNGAMICN